MGHVIASGLLFARGLVLKVVAAAVLFAGSVTTHSGWRHQQCRYANLDGKPAFSYLEVKRTIWCAVDHWAVPGGASKAVAVAECESGLYPLASNGSYAGVFQQALAYWPIRFLNLRPRGWKLSSSVWNARSNVVISIRMAHEGGWGPWACA